MGDVSKLENRKAKLPLFSLIVLCDEIRIEVFQGHLSLGGLVEGVSAKADIVCASHLQHPCNKIKMKPHNFLAFLRYIVIFQFFNFF